MDEYKVERKIHVLNVDVIFSHFIMCTPTYAIVNIMCIFLVGLIKFFNINF